MMYLHEHKKTWNKTKNTNFSKHKKKATTTAQIFSKSDSTSIAHSTQNTSTTTPLPTKTTNKIFQQKRLRQNGAIKKLHRVLLLPLRRTISDICVVRCSSYNHGGFVEGYYTWSTDELGFMPYMDRYTTTCWGCADWLCRCEQVRWLSTPFYHLVT